MHSLFFFFAETCIGCKSRFTFAPSQRLVLVFNIWILLGKYGFETFLPIISETELTSFSPLFSFSFFFPCLSLTAKNFPKPMTHHLHRPFQSFFLLLRCTQIKTETKRSLNVQNEMHLVTKKNFKNIFFCQMHTKCRHNAQKTLSTFISNQIQD